MEQGAIIMPSVRKEPLARREPISSKGYQQSARFLKSERLLPNSRNAVRSPERETIRCVSALFWERIFSSKRQPYIDPLAPVTPITIRKIPPKGDSGRANLILF